ncbi:RDD family protein [Streptomyces sp. NBC_01275]|uniref:RDD family protein n=1 Tax=Streptomyces sp. NBC_01275 TaxID=2903807 RepID=UPI00224D3DAE|nr:RDD family protein [Streptomyces sp. NBC_01275]MCX4762480.1 RDD family protein [Streptomyces sp. NBC_01275]
MSAPTPAPGDDRPREGYYPDPSIPGYVRYWNGSAWVPGTSRPAPSAGEPLGPPAGDGAQQAAPPAAPVGSAASVEETGPHFFDEDPKPAEPYGGRPEPASAWGADRAHQSGFGGDQDRRVSWGSPQGPDPRVPSPTPEGMATAPPAGSPSGPSGPAVPVADEGTVTFRAPGPRTGGRSGASGAYPGGTDSGPAFAPAAAAPAAPVPASTPAKPGFAAGKAAAERAAAAQAQAAQAQAGPAPQGPTAFPPAAAQAASQAPAVSSPPPASPAAPSTPDFPQQSGAPQPTSAPMANSMSPGLGGGQPSWAQQVHQLAGAEDGLVPPWKPPVDDVFQAAARRAASARPAGLGKRLAARLVDTLVLAAVTSAAAVPLGAKALDHVNEKIDAAKLTGQTVTVWLLDGTTSVYLGIVLAVLLLFGVVYEVLPTAKWGRTLGKKLLGLEVRDIEGGEPPSFGAALRRWLVYSVPGLLAIGVVGVVWGVFDRPWRQCWHDKAAHTFVAG